MFSSAILSPAFLPIIRTVLLETSRKRVLMVKLVQNCLLATLFLVIMAKPSSALSSDTLVVALVNP